MENTLDLDFSSAFGEAGKNSSASKTIYLRAKSLKEGESVIARVIPPFKSNKKYGLYAQRHSIHWGYKRTNPMDDTQPNWMFLFRCVEVYDFQAKKVKQACPQCKDFDQNAKALEDLTKDIEAAVKAAMGSKEPTKDDLFKAKKADPKWMQLSNWTKTYNCDRKYYLAVKFLDGTFGNIVIGATGYEDLKKYVEKLGKEKTIDPREGCFFVFSKGKDSTGRISYSVEPYQEEIEVDGEPLQRRKKAPLTKDDLPKIERFCMDLKDAHGANILSVEQVQRLVDEGQGNAELGAELYEATKDTLKNVASPEVEGEPSVENASPVKAAKAAPMKLKAAKLEESDPSGLEALRAVTKHKGSITGSTGTYTEEELLAHLDQS